MAQNKGETDPRFMVAMGLERFDPKSQAAKARRQVAAGKKKLAKALGVPVTEIPGTDREAYLVQLEEDPKPRPCDAFETNTTSSSNKEYLHSRSSNGWTERRPPRCAATLPFVRRFRSHRI